MFRFPDVAPLPCAMDATIVQCRGVHFSFPAPPPSQAAPPAVASARGNRTPGVAFPLPQASLACSTKGASNTARSGQLAAGRNKPNNGARSAQTATPPSKPAGSGGELLEGVTLDLTRKSRVVLVGRNGSGKSTLLKLIAAATGVDGDAGGGAAVDALVPTKGSIVRNHNARVGLFTQHHAERLRMSDSPLQHMQRVFTGVEGINEAELRRQLGCCGITGSLALQEMRSLSGGQKSRVVLAELMTHRPHLLLLDEPTNHLDLASIEALKDALDGYGGGVILASHDQALICDMLDSPDDSADGAAGGLPRGELWEVKAHRVLRREGGIAEYLAELTALAGKRDAKRAAAAR